jgi:hypothetical protein
MAKVGEYVKICIAKTKKRGRDSGIVTTKVDQLT